MKIYLVRHGAAQLKSVDPARPLTERGRQDVQRVAAYMGRLGLEVHQIRHSNKTRAEQTATIFGESLCPPGGVVAVSGLAPNDDVRPVANDLMRQSQPVMLVGHLPFLARLAGLLLTGDPNRHVMRFCEVGTVCLARQGDRWLVAWILTPEMAGA